ncbi:MAG: hypothetical protein IKG81_04855 [Bacteroidales bacterium]|nr:hypothetical protein [Bacteroidales bacterium]
MSKQGIRFAPPYLLLVCVVSFLLLLTGCQSKKPKLFDPSQVNFAVAYNPYLENQFYPSLVLGVASLSDLNYGLTDTNALFSISVTAPVSNAVLRITIDSSKLNYVTIFQEVLPTKDMRYTFYPTVKWKFDKLYRTRQQGTADLTFTCYINDEEVDIKNLRINYRSANDCLLSVRDANNHNHDYRWLFAAYVNEEHPYIDSILSGILSQGVVSKITGYQGDTKSVVSQVEAIWYYALDRGITYSSISCTATPTTRSNVQHIRFFDEVYNSRQANCVDACVFFASIIRKIGLKPVIFVEPCHAYLGYYTDKGRRNLRLLETTITAWVDFPALTRDYNAIKEANPNAQGTDRISPAMNTKYLKYLTPDEKKQWEEDKMDFETFKRAVAHSLFLKASEYDKDNYQNNKKLFANSDNMQYQQLDIEQLRKIVQPIN